MDLSLAPLVGGLRLLSQAKNSKALLMKAPQLFLAVGVILCGSSLTHAQSTISLFDGESLDGWMTPRGGPVPEAWEAVDGAIHLKTDGGRGGNIVTEKLYGDFELRFEWKISKDGNSGIKYRVKQFGNSFLGCEFQILDDDGHRDAQTPKRSTGSLYDVYAPNANKFLRPVGEYNQSRIVVWGNHLEHWLNGHHILSADVGSWDWWQKKAASKFSDKEGFGENRYGRIMLTDHSSEVWYRGLELTPLAPPPEPQYVSYPARRCRPRRMFRWRRR